MASVLDYNVPVKENDQKGKRLQQTDDMTKEDGYSVREQRSQAHLIEAEAEVPEDTKRRTINV